MGVKGRLHFDLSGLGMGARVAFDDVLVTRPYLAYSFQAGSEVGGKDEMLDSRYSNGAVFSRRNAQAWYWLRHRAENTRRLVDGEKVDPIDCLFLDPNGIEDIEEFKAQLSQPKWKHDTAGRMVAVKADEEKGERSPDLGDAAMMAFAADTDYGIRLKYAEFSEAA